MHLHFKENKKLCEMKNYYFSFDYLFICLSTEVMNVKFLTENIEHFLMLIIIYIVFVHKYIHIFFF